MLIEDGNGYKTVKISRADTKGKIIDISDSVSYTTGEKIIEKVRFSTTEYGGASNVNVSYFMDLDDFKLLTWNVRCVSQTPMPGPEYKGTRSDKYSTGFESRMLNVSYWAEGAKGAGAYTVTIANGPGTEGDKGQVMPATSKSDETRTVKIILPIPEMQRILMSAESYFDAKLCAFLTLNWEEIYG